MTPLIIFYDNFCPNCTNFASLIQKLNWLKLIEIKQLRNEFQTNLFCDFDIKIAVNQMASYNTKWHYGYNTLYYTFLRIPLFWVFIPFLYILKITKLGQLIYVELALKRKVIPIHCNLDSCKI